MEIVKVPVERTKAIIGENGRTKKLIESKCNVKLYISEGEVRIDGDAYGVFIAKDVVKAIARGFSPRDAIKIATQDYHLYIFNLKDWLNTPNSIRRIKARVIGEKGRIKSEIENATDSIISVYGSTVAILAKPDSLEYAKEAVEKIIRGARHSSVLGYLSRVKRRLFEERLRG